MKKQIQREKSFAQEKGFSDVTEGMNSVFKQWNRKTNEKLLLQGQERRGSMYNDRSFGVGKPGYENYMNYKTVDVEQDLEK